MSLLAGLLVAGCTEAEAPEPASGGSTPAQPSPAAAAPTQPSAAGIAVALEERRLNIGEDTISMRVTNTTEEPVSITAATLTTPLYQESNSWTPGPSGQSSLRAGGTVALPAQLATAPRCGENPDPTAAPPTGPAPPTEPAAPAEPATVILTINGKDHSYAASDPEAALTQMNRKDCLAHAVRQVATLELLPELAIAPDRHTAVVHLQVVPTGSGGTATIDAFGPTTLLTEDPQQPWPRSVSITGTDGPIVISLSVLPARCDAHALAEDKTGTKLPVDVSVANTSGQLRLNPSPAFTHAIYSFVQAACLG